MNILFISNGHGEDLNAGLIIDALQRRSPEFNLFALPLVGEGKAYQHRGIPLIAPTQPLPSGGLIYTGWRTWWRDIVGGLVALTIKQIQALIKQKEQFDLIVAIGDIVPLAFARLSGKPYLSFLVANSSYYEGRLPLPFTVAWCLKSPHCLGAIAKDHLTAEDLGQRGINIRCLGYPIMDALQPTAHQLERQNKTLIALLPGSRVPEALNNLSQLLPLCVAIAQEKTVDFWAALVPAITVGHLQILAENQGWQCHGDRLERGKCTIHLSWHQFADILHQADLVLGMAGTAVEQAVGLGKPVLQIPGQGPQFTYGFAEAQMRLLGYSVTTVGKSPQEPGLINKASQKALEILADPHYQQQCWHNGQERIGPPGGSQAIADYIATTAATIVSKG
ncbi:MULTISPECIES: lipid-A-disaccharide synthase-related protein [unclassified Synechocystis]|uniref:lipid-A-disaccharide synthase-related protein n=1 Tax=unclassified Synechocystis TaxID=2640012 RepID=UPI0004050F2C|nr:MULTISPECIES: lipid-A-disaccharide synthase-related protein [unclassified Synechocystis]AIE74160.1 hypothetical protein D082_16320 [Synechocystis sp. PCC 6714]MCT0252797.1 lipid-A-disaccharide synthase-related protein [Synechocystis sp. CS-94]